MKKVFAILLGTLLLSGSFASAQLKPIDDKLGAGLEKILENLVNKKEGAQGNAIYIDWLKCSTRWNSDIPKPLCGFTTSTGPSNWDNHTSAVSDEVALEIFNFMTKISQILNDLTSLKDILQFLLANIANRHIDPNTRHNEPLRINQTGELMA